MFTMKRNVHNAYPRVLTFPEHVPFCVIHVVVDVGQWFGLQESNYFFGVVTEFILSRSYAHLSRICPLPISTMATYDFIIYSPPDVVQRVFVSTH
jgi:hypothetical protein